jgi:hypothetical protein
MFAFEVDEAGNNTWRTLKSVSLKAGESANIPFETIEKGQWIRVNVNQQTRATLHLSYSQKDMRSTTPDAIFAGLANISETEASAGLLWGLGNNRRKPGILAGTDSDNIFYLK